MSETGIYIRVGNDNVLLENLNEIERTIWLESLSENGLIRTVNICCDVIEDFIVNYQHLQQENQQLKEQLELYENGVIYDSRVDKLESVLDEIREYINKEIREYKYAMNEVQMEDYIEDIYDTIIRNFENALQILDKVKE